MARIAVVSIDLARARAIAGRGLGARRRPGFYRRATLWATRETPVDNTIEGDRSLTPVWGAGRYRG